MQPEGRRFALLHRLIDQFAPNQRSAVVAYLVSYYGVPEVLQPSAPLPLTNAERQERFRARNRAVALRNDAGNAGVTVRNAESNEIVTKSNGESNGAVTPGVTLAPVVSSLLPVVGSSKSKAKDRKPEVHVILELYSQLFEEKFGVKPVIAGAKDGALLKKLLASHSNETVSKTMRKFIESNDEFIRKSGQTIGVFYACFNKLLVGSNGHRLISAKNAGNIEVGRRFIFGREVKE